MTPPVPSPTRRRRRGLTTLALVGLAVIGLSACSGHAYMAVNGPNFPAEHVDGDVGFPGLTFTHDGPGGNVVTIDGGGAVQRGDGSYGAIQVNIWRKANGIEYAGNVDYKLKNGHTCKWIIDDDAGQIGESGLTGVAVSNCEGAGSSAIWRFDPT